jgi:diaminohydroxyphosphoribosylaminopyrimidine deaminase / 5-amino-6-(5-phosphoribosylamino)uracil reductase
MNNFAIDLPIDFFDREIMQRCLLLARRARGQTSPNPLVGSVIVREGKIVGEGFHPGAGKPHAEIFALKEAGELAQGSTLYVNLEPCNHHGRTPPCCDALIAAKVSRVVVGMIDPDLRVSGSGVEKLKAAGIEVVVGVEEEDCRSLNEAFIHRVTYKRPFGILKYAMTLDGKIAATTGHSAWVTGNEARHYVRKLRSHCDAIIVGGNTVRLDNPYLTTHQVATHNPLRVIMSRKLDLPIEAHVWETSEASTLVFTELNSNPNLQKQLLRKGVEIVELNPLTPKQVMQHLYNRELSCVLWECGGVLGAKAIASGAVQKVMAFIAPKIIGGQTAPSPVGDLGLTRMTEALELKNITIQSLGEDILVEGYLPSQLWEENDTKSNS